MIEFTENMLERLFFNIGNGIEPSAISKEIITHFIVEYLSEYLKKQDTSKIVERYKEKMKEERQPDFLINKAEAALLEILIKNKKGAR